MHHTFGSVKGDTLCPLGFHPQVRWPTRCKRCFRDYKDHSGKRSLNKVDTTSSSPSLSRWEPSPNRSSESPESKRIWASTSNLAKDENQPKISTSSASAEWSASAIDIPSLVESSTPTWQEDSTSRSRNFTGSKSESFHHRRHSIDETSLQSSSINDRPAKLQIKQVRKKNKAEIEDAVENKEKSETENLKTQLSELKARCEKAEREKSEILLRRLATMDSKASKSSEISRLQKSLKELTSKNEALTEEKTTLLAKLKNLEKENESKGGVKSERERATEELKSKLKAAETLCESLMDENEDMKKEIRELEEEIYEMQDNFREEQADEYTNLRKSLEQSNKNCRILSFKLRKLERKTEQLETEKNDLENKYDETRKIDEIMKKISNDFKNKKLNKNEHTIKSELKKTLENIGKELGDSYVGFMNIMQLGLDSPGLKEQDSTLKYDKLIKDNELLQQKLDNALKELANEKESNKSSGTSLKNDPLNLKKKLNEATAARESERKAWDLEKTKLQEEKEKLKSKLLSLSAEKLKIYNEVLQLKKDLEIATSSEKNNAKMEATINDLKKELSSEKEKCKKLQDDLIISTEKESRVSKNLAKMEQTKTTMESELKRLKSEFESIKSTTSTKLAKVTGELVEVKKDRDKLKSQVEEDKIAKDNEVGSLKKKISALEKAGANAKKMNELKQTYTEKIAILEEEMKKGQEQFDDLHTKHAALQDVKRELESQVEMLNRQTMEHKNALESAETRLKTLEENMKAKENSWSKEKVRLEEMLRERERSMAMNVQFEEFREEASRLGKENESLRIQLEDMKKNNDDLSSKLNDYNAVTKIQRNLSADSSALDTELRKTKNALVEAEKTRKTDLAQCKMRYEQRIKAINDEIQSIQNQLSRYKRERDTYKHMLEGAQRTIAELKSTRQRRPSTTSTGKSDEDEESTGTNISTLERQISMMEDELSESKLETSKLKTELVSERSGWQIKLSEMQSRINELEEERILASGRTKIPGLKARIELAWQKEREEQQRLLQETATLARDLRQTLYEVERERDKERLENKRRQEQTKKIFDEEKEESKKKLIELQCDLLELRDAHAKLRTSNEKMRREKERHEREREEFKDILANKRRMEQIEAKNINVLLKQVDDLMRLFPELSGKTENNGKMDNYTPTPPRRTKGPKSRESSPMLETKDEIKGSMTNLGVRSEKLEYTIKKLMEVTKEIQETKKLSVGNEFSSKKKLTKRSSSIDDDSGRGSSSSRSSRPSLKRKSLSLEQTSVKNDQLIWGTDSNVSSMQSLDSEVDTRHFSMQRDSSVDSRLSGGSTKSEILHKDKKYNKNLIRKITTKLTKSASVDDPSSSYDFGLQTSGSEASIIDDSKSEKKNLKKKLSDMFKRSSSKSNGLNKKSLDESSRPASRTSNTSRR
ncbi:protein MLP1 homolog isoform X2 [Chelonus insularis]|uniref:protein MLP1 homolog isoform X2 n=1 Tax=Chelonus insularis TaxID=460826 RepID=UPI001589A311|nr:protein MLP1 homolog isoform X2 [Chelonus insularis]